MNDRYSSLKSDTVCKSPTGIICVVSNVVYPLPQTLLLQALTRLLQSHLDNCLYKCYDVVTLKVLKKSISILLVFALTFQFDISNMLLEFSGEHLRLSLKSFLVIALKI